MPSTSRLQAFFLQLLLCLMPLLMGEVVGQSPMAKEVTPETLDSLRTFLKRGESQRYLSFNEVMGSAERAFYVKDYAEVQRSLSRASIAGIPNSRWFELRYLTLLAQSKPDAAQKVLVEGFSRYPYAENLARLVGEQQLGENATRKSFLKGNYPANIRFELAAKLAFKQGDIVTGLLDAEQAFYTDDQLHLDTALRRTTVLFYRNLLLAKGETKDLLDSALYADSSFAKSYLNCLSEAARKVYTAAESSGGKIFQDQNYLSRVRVSALRIYADRGHLAKWQHPLLVDLYVLDKAGYFDESSMLLLDLIDPASVRAYQKENPGKLERAIKYLNEEWGSEVDIFLANF